MRRIVLLCALLVAMTGGGWTNARSVLAETKQISGAGGIGNTRDDILSAWDLERVKDSGQLTDEAHIQTIIYDVPKYQFFFLFQLEQDDKVRDSDRLIGITVSYIKSANPSAAQALIERLLPTDAKKDGQASKNKFDETVQRYSSDLIAAQFPDINIEGFGTPGQVWVTIFLLGSNVGVFDITLYDEDV